MLLETLTFIATAGVVLAISGIGLSDRVKAATSEAARRRMLNPRGSHRREISTFEIGGALTVATFAVLVLVAAQLHVGSQSPAEMLAVIFPQ
jgi:hypothetical protein